MLGTWKGIGTKFYGSKDQDANGSFITTEWFVILFFPILPIASYRVFFKGTERGCSGSTHRFEILNKLGLDWGQIFTIYFVNLLAITFAVLTGKFVGFFFMGTEWEIFVPIFIVLIAILVIPTLFFEAKPSNFSRRRTTRGINKSVSPTYTRADPPIAQNYNNQFNVNLAKMPTPNIYPPANTSEIDITPLEPLLEKNETFIRRLATDPNTRPPEWLPVKEALQESILLNFQSISQFMNNEVIKNSKENIMELNELVSKATTMGSLYAWIIGKEWKQKDPDLRHRLIEKDTIQLDEVPHDALQLLLIAVLFPYYIFAQFFIDYYDSPYGHSVKYQKTPHLIDTYQAMMKGILACFLMGLKS